MTSAHTAPHARRTLTRAALLALTLVAFAASGCSSVFKGPEFTDPNVVVAPYDAPREVVFAVAPLRNESGAGVVNELTLTDRLVEALTQVQGLTALPTNRAVSAMRSLDMDRVSTPAEARQLAERLGADGIIVGTITSYDPYDPPRIGMNLVLHARTRVMQGDGSSGFIDPVALQRAATDAGISITDSGDLPVSAFGQVIDASNHDVLSDIKRFAAGRHDPDTAMGWRIYVKSVTRYAEYVGYRAARSLMDSERRRLTHRTRETDEIMTSER